MLLSLTQKKHRSNHIFLTIANGWIFLAVGLIIVISFHKVIPYNMDEFVQFKQLRCFFYPNNQVLEGSDCGWLNLVLPGTTFALPLRAYDYIGSFPSLYYLPLFLIWKSPISARLVGYLFLGLQALLLHKLFKIRTSVLLAGLILFFPYFFQHIVDTGPVVFQTTSIIAIYLLLDRWFKSGHFRYVLGIGLLVFLGMWTKINYVWFLPGIALITCIKAIEFRKSFWDKKNKLFIQGVVVSVLSLFLTLSYLFASNPGNRSHRPLIDSLLSGESRTVTNTIRKLWSLDVTRKLLNPFQTTSRIFEINPDASVMDFYGLSLYLFIPLLFLVAFAAKKVWKPTLLYIAFLMTFFIIAMTKNASLMHHVVLAFPFFILFVCEMYVELRKAHFKPISNFLCATMVCAFVLINSAVFLLVPTQKIIDWDDPSKMEVAEVLNDSYIASNYIFIHANWGSYFYTGLFGHKNQAAI